MRQGGGLGSPEQQKKMLNLLLIALLLVVGWRFVLPAMKGWTSEKAGQSRASKRVAKTKRITKRPVVMVKLEDLNAEAATYEPNRNIFRYGQRRVAPPPPPPPPPYVPPPPPPPVVDPGPPVRRPPPVDLDLLGIFGPEDRRIAVLIDGKEIINALHEDVIKDQFIVNEIGLQWVEFRFVDFPEDETTRIEIGER